MAENRQAGVSLMLAVLILSSITAIAFSVATIVFIEIRSSGDSLRTEPALYATFGVTEEALFQYKRNVQNSLNVPACTPKAYNICEINDVSLTLPGTQPLAFDNNPRVEFIEPSTQKVIPMYVVNNYTKQYESVVIKVLPNAASAPIRVSFNITNVDGSTSSTAPVTVTPGTQYQYQSFNSSGQYELVLNNTSITQPLSVSIVTTRVGNATPSGLPFVGQRVLRIMANYLGLTRTYQVNIPIP